MNAGRSAERLAERRGLPRWPDGSPGRASAGCALLCVAAIGRGMTEDRPRLGSGENTERLFAERDALDKTLHRSGVIVGSGERVA